MKFKTILILATLIAAIKSDVPSHCLSHQLVGEWTINFTNTVPGQHHCGHTVPSNQESIYLVDLPSQNITLKENQTKPYAPLKHTGQSFKYRNHIKKVTVRLEKDHKVTFVKGNYLQNAFKELTWSTVYSQGLSLDKNKSREKPVVLFTFFNYGKKDKTNKNIKSNWISKCNSTTVGWGRIGKEHFCFNMFKNNTNPNEVTGGEADGAEGPRAVTAQGMNLVNDKPPSGLTSFLQTSIKSLDPADDYQSMIDRVNNSNLSWKATFYPFMIGKRPSDFMTKAARAKIWLNNDFESFLEKKPLTKKEIDAKIKTFIQEHDKNTHSNHAVGFITEGNDHYWNTKYEVRNQGGCGSCFAMSSLTMLEMKLRINYPSFPEELLKLSVDEQVKCNFYSQGCDGGYPYTIGMWGNEKELLLEKCYNQNSCEKSCEGEIKNIQVKVRKFGYLGGFYKHCDKEAMKEELKNGPILIAFKPDNNFNSYKKGILSGNKESNLLEITENGQNKDSLEWQNADHSVVIIGYGEEKGKHYWICINSYGKEWGMKGKFKVEQDTLATQSHCEAMEISLFYNKKLIKPKMASTKK